MREMRAATLLLAAMIVAASGCSSRSHGFLGLTWDDDEVPRSVDVEPIRKRAVPRVAVYCHYAVDVEDTVAAVSHDPDAEGNSDADAEDDERTDAGDQREFAREVIGRRLTDVLRRTGAFVSVIEVGDPTVPFDHTGLIAEAREQGASYLLVLHIDDETLVRTGIEPIAGTVLWLLGGFPSWWVANHHYEMQYGLTAEIHDLASARDALEQDFGTMFFRDSVNFVERTGDVLPYLLTWVWPSTFCPVDDNTVASGFSGYCVRGSLPALFDLCGEVMTGRHVEARVASDQSVADGALLELIYPRPRIPVMVGDGRVVLDMRAIAPPDRYLTRVTVAGEQVFPNPDRPDDPFIQPYRQLRITWPFAVGEAEQVPVQITDSTGATVTREIRLLARDPGYVRNVIDGAR